MVNILYTETLQARANALHQRVAELEAAEVRALFLQPKH